MCGCFNLITTKLQIMEHFSLQRPPDYQPDVNILPGQKFLTFANNLSRIYFLRVSQISWQKKAP